MLLNVLGDFSSSITRICYNPNYEELLKAHTEKSNFFLICFFQFVFCSFLAALPMWLGRFEKFLGDKTFIAGETVTVADFPLFEVSFLFLFLFFCLQFLMLFSCSANRCSWFQTA